MPPTHGPAPRSAPRGRRVFLAAFAAALGPLSFGYALGYSSPAIPSLQRAAPPAPRLDQDAASWFGVSRGLGSPAGPSSCSPPETRSGTLRPPPLCLDLAPGPGYDRRWGMAPGLGVHCSALDRPALRPS